jgi:hypothetical protein
MKVDHMNARDESQLALVATGLSFPTSFTFDPDGVAYIAESGLPFGGAPPGGRVWRLGNLTDASDGQRALLAEGLRPPVNGLTWHGGRLYISEGDIQRALAAWTQMDD